MGRTWARSHHSTTPRGRKPVPGASRARSRLHRQNHALGRARDTTAHGKRARTCIHLNCAQTQQQDRCPRGTPQSMACKDSPGRAGSDGSSPCMFNKRTKNVITTCLLHHEQKVNVLIHKATHWLKNGSHRFFVPSHEPALKHIKLHPSFLHEH